MKIGAIGEVVGSTGWTCALGHGSVVGGSGICGWTAPEFLLEADLTLARYAVKAPPARPWDPDVDEALPTLSVSDGCTE